MQSSQMLEPGDQVTITVVRAERVQPGEIYWGTERSPGQPRKGFIMESEGVPVPHGALSSRDAPGRVWLDSMHFESDALVLVQVR